MNRLSVVAALLLLLLLAGVRVVSGHEGASAWMHVPGDSVDAGATFEVLGNDLPPDSLLEVRAVSAQGTFDLGVAMAGRDGHFSATFTMPAELRNGYVELVATSPDGTTASTWVLVGPRTEQTAPPPATPDSRGGIDPSLIVLGVLLGGAVGGVGYLLLRPKRHSTTIGSPRVRAKR